MEKLTKLTDDQQKKVYDKPANVKIFTIVQIIKCIDTAVNRGAFKGSEMSYVGSIYDVLSEGVDKAIKQTTHDTEDPNDEDEKIVFTPN